MEWVKPGDYSKSNVDRIGEVLRGKRKVEEKSQEEAEALSTFNNWRASHAYPLHIIMKNIKKLALQISSESVCVQRLKRIKRTLSDAERFLR